MATRIAAISQKRKKGGKQMKAPDKLYVRIAEDDNFGTASIEQRSFTKAYIHKDTLLEWLIEQRDCSVYTDQDAYEAFQEIIDKLNSM